MDRKLIFWGGRLVSYFSSSSLNYILSLFHSLLKGKALMRSGWKAKLQRGRQEQAEHSRLGKTENSCFVLSAEKKVWFWRQNWGKWRKPSACHSCMWVVNAYFSISYQPYFARSLFLICGFYLFFLWDKHCGQGQHKLFPLQVWLSCVKQAFVRDHYFWSSALSYFSWSQKYNVLLELYFIEVTETEYKILLQEVFYLIALAAVGA